MVEKGRARDEGMENDRGREEQREGERWMEGRREMEKKENDGGRVVVWSGGGKENNRMKE